MITLDLGQFIPAGGVANNDRPINLIWAEFLEYAFEQAYPQGATILRHATFYDVVERLRTLNGNMFELSADEFVLLRVLLIDVGRFPANTNRVFAQLLKAFGISAPL